jgi:hypothetical protein
MEIIAELLESACAELEACGHPELAAELRPIIAKVEAMEETTEAIEDEEAEEETPADEE